MNETIRGYDELTAGASSTQGQLLLPRRQMTVEQGIHVARLVNATNPHEVAAYQQLRYDHFVREKGWIAANLCRPGCETDRYDAHALHLAVFKGQEIMAYLRVLPFQSSIGFMLDEDFAVLLKDEEPESLLRENAVELSRLVCRSNPQRQKQEGPRPLELLLKLLYHVSQERGFTRFYIVVEQDWLRPFARRFGLAFRTIGTPHTFADGTRAVAATATLAELEVGMRDHNPAKSGWYQDRLASDDNSNDKEAAAAGAAGA